MAYNNFINYMQGLKQSDQRMTEDVEKFAASIS